MSNVLTVKQVASRLHLSLSQTYQLLSEGQTPCRRGGLKRGKILIDEVDFDAYGKQCRSALASKPELEPEFVSIPKHLRSPSPDRRLCCRPSPRSSDIYTPNMLARGLVVNADQWCQEALLVMARQVLAQAVSAEDVLDAYGQAMGPRAENRGAVFTTALKRVGWRPVVRLGMNSRRQCNLGDGQGRGRLLDPVHSTPNEAGVPL